GAEWLGHGRLLSAGFVSYNRNDDSASDVIRNDPSVCQIPLPRDSVMTGKPRSSDSARPVARLRPLRADAERNRQPVLEVAQAVFASEGLAVPIDEIARRAGLGVGTLYRHFATKEALYEAILVNRMQALVEEARAAAGAEDPGEAFFEIIGRFIEES